MIGRRLAYGALLLGAGVLHFAYGQYVTFYILLFLLVLPVLSLFASLPAILSSHAELIGSADVQRGHSCDLRMLIRCSFFLPPDLYRVKIEQRNLYLEQDGTKVKLNVYGTKSHDEIFPPNTDRLGIITYRIRSVRACDYLGLFSIPIKKKGTITLTVLPNAEKPVPMPDLLKTSELVRKPKPLGFSEEHELRPYREGDAVNLIHWKLTEKMDTPIVREPQEMLRRRVVLCMDLYGDYDAQQSVLEQLRCLADILNNSGIPFLLYYGLRTVHIEGEGDLIRFLKSLFSERMHDEKCQPAAGGADTLVYRIEPQKEVRP